MPSVALVLAAAPGTPSPASASSPNGPIDQRSGLSVASAGTSASGSGSLSTSQQFDQRVAQTERTLVASGASLRELLPPYTGRPAEVVHGVVIPGAALPPSNVTSYYTAAPAPAGISYYGENDTSGAIVGTTVEASSVAGTVTVNELRALYMDDDTPDLYGIQLNVVLTNVTLQGSTGYTYWVQNVIDYSQNNESLGLGDALWNWSSPYAIIPTDNSTILRHDPNGTNSGTYGGIGPWIHAPMPYTLTLYTNSSVTSDREQELWFNYSLWAAGGIHRSGNYDWIVFNSTNPQHPGTPALAPFEATGVHLNKVDLTNDYELDIVGPYDASNLDVLAANVSATLDYCPAAIASCPAGDFRSVPAAEDFGADTGETSSGLSISYSGTTAYGTAGPYVLRGLWGFSGAAGSAEGATPVANAITVSGSPVPLTTEPYVFVFFNGSTFLRRVFAWAPDVPTWYLPPGTYQYEVMLADYAEQTGTLTVGSGPTQLSVNLPYDPASGVYTPLWAFGNAQLAGIASSGNGTISNQYRLFNNPTSGCSECGNAKDGYLAPEFFSSLDGIFPTFMGIWLVGTDAYVDIDNPVSFDVFSFTYGPSSNPLEGPDFYLQIGLLATHHVTLAGDVEAGGWPDMFELITDAGPVDASENLFPQANVMIWNSTDDLVMSNTFVPAWLPPAYGTKCNGICPAVVCDDCVSPDGLLLYGGTNNTVWGNTFRDPSAPSYAPVTQYAGLAEAESGDRIFNNNFSIDNPTVALPFDIYNDSCPILYTGQCGPPLPPTHGDLWNVTVQPAQNIALTVNGFPLSGNILGSGCPTQGGNYWSDYGTTLNPTGQLPFTNVYDYYEVRSAVSTWIVPDQRSIPIGGDYAPLVRGGSCGTGPSGVGSLSATLSVALLWLSVAGGVLVAGILVTQPLWRARPAPWLTPTPGRPATGEAPGPPSETVPSPARPTLRERWARRPPSVGFLVGTSVLGAYLIVALSAILVFRGSLDQLPQNLAWVPPYPPIGPSLAHPFGIMPGFGTDLMDALWRATPGDLGIVTGILVIDVFLGFFLGAVAGLDEGGLVDAAVTFVGDSIGTIPTFALAAVVFAGFVAVAPRAVTLPVFVAVFGVILWPTMARTVRERSRTIAHQPYVDAARASGASTGRVLTRHIMPNSLTAVLAQVPLDIAPIFFVLAAFPWFYNCQLPGGPPTVSGAPPPPYLVPSLPYFSPLPSASFPEWGYLLGFGTCEGFDAAGNFGNWWMYLFPLLVIVILGLAIGLVCDGIERWRHFDR